MKQQAKPMPTAPIKAFRRKWEDLTATMLDLTQGHDVAEIQRHERMRQAIAYLEHQLNLPEEIRNEQRITKTLAALRMDNAADIRTNETEDKVHSWLLSVARFGNGVFERLLPSRVA